MPANGPTFDDVAQFLAVRHGESAADIELLRGGFWSAAYGYRVDDRELVLRIGRSRAWFEIDRNAMAFISPDLPVPEVLEIGDAFGGAYAISVRHRGRFLETVATHEAEVAGPTIVRLLAALKSAPSGATATGWKNWLMDGFVDDPRRQVSGWRTKLAADEKLDSLFRTCESRVRELTESCPERGDLVHGDLLHSNVLISEDASRVNAVFSWKCSTRGDFLYDVAWCTFWGGVPSGNRRGRCVSPSGKRAVHRCRPAGPRSRSRAASLLRAAHRCDPPRLERMARRRGEPPVGRGPHGRNPRTRSPHG